MLLCVVLSSNDVALRCPSSCLLPASKRKPACGCGGRIVKAFVYNHQQGSGISEGGKQALHNLCRTASHPSCLSPENINDSVWDIR